MSAIVFNVSVIIPVYNAKDYINEAVLSVLHNIDVEEIILIYDGSQDGSYDKCLELSNKYSKVKLFTHKNKSNRGAAASRNLGILNAKYNFICFLDADDIYLSNRFVNAKRIFNSNPDADGVYEAIGVFFENYDAEQEFVRAGLSNLTTVKNYIEPKLLFKAFMRGGLGGHFSIIGLVLKRGVFSSGLHFNEDLKLYEDTFFIFQLSKKFNLYHGNIVEPIALRRVHLGNRITKAFNDEIIKYNTVKVFWEISIKWANSELQFKERNWIFEKALADIIKLPLKNANNIYCYFLRRINLVKFAITNPAILSCKYFWKILLPYKIIILLNKNIVR